MWTRTYRHAYELLLVFYDRDTRTEFVGSENWLVKGPVGNKGRFHKILIFRCPPKVQPNKAVKPSVIFQEYQRDKLRKMIESFIPK